MVNDYNDDMKGIAIGTFNFEDFVTGNDTVYVDKTMYAYALVRNPKRKFCFVSRPRRYGKSLFCSMLHAIFDGRKELFRDLYIGKTDYPFEKYPVLHFDFSGMNMRTADTFLNVFRSYIRYQAESNGIELLSDSPSAMLDELIIKLSDEKGPVVILIDEFDAPFTSGSAEKDIQDTARREFNAFYATIKKYGSRIRFSFITGVVKLSNLSIFSAMNNLTDLSMQPEFASAFGYTEDELEEYFGEGIDEYVEAHPDVKRDDFKARIKAYYDGYRFSPDSDVTVYNPVSIGEFFTYNCRFRNYWNRTGVPTFAIELAKRCNLSELLDAENLFISEEAFTSFDISQINSSVLSRSSVIALLYFAGYLTFKGSEEVGFPNAEVKVSFIQNLVSRYAYAGNDDAYMSMWLLSFIAACREGDEEKVHEKLDEFFAAFSYELTVKERERFYHLIFHAIFIVSSIKAFAEDRGPMGRADEVIFAGDHIWIFELKVDKSADEALKQIEEKGYAAKYAYLLKPGMVVHKVGISFSSETRKIEEWKSLHV